MSPALSPVPSVAVHTLNGLVGKRVEVTTAEGTRPGIVFAASVIGQAPGLEPVASFRDPNGRSDDPRYFRVFLADIVSINPAP